MSKIMSVVVDITKLIMRAKMVDYTSYSYLWFLMRMKARLWGIVMHLFNGLYCYLTCFRIVLLMKHWKNIFPRNFSWQKTP